MSKAHVISRKPYNWLYGLGLAFIIVSAWICVHLYSVFFHDLNAPLRQTLGLIILQCWLYTGVFIVAHDTMHGSLFPRHPKFNSVVGHIILFIYAGFNWTTLKHAHLDHHRYSGSSKDPDFHSKNPHDFWPWYFKFFRQYFGLRQVLTLITFTLIYLFVLKASYLNTVVMWAIPALLSSVQLFYFGTYLTHRQKTEFSDHHNARSNNYPRLLSLLTCFHFGYHHEHHLYPHEPWWRLPLRKNHKATNT